MYIYCKKDFNNNNFKFEKGKKYPVTSYYNGIYYFEYNNGKSDLIHITYIDKIRDYVEIIKTPFCKHSELNRESIDDLIICSECDELISINEDLKGE